jgi:hypothetical protein
VNSTGHGGSQVIRREAEKLRDLARLLVDSWNRGDAQGFASLFTLDAEYVAGSGERLRGREAISQLVGPVPGSHVCLAGEASVECDGTRGQLRFAWSMCPESGLSRRGRISCTCLRDESGWLIEALQNLEDRSVGKSGGRPGRSI